MTIKKETETAAEEEIADAETEEETEEEAEEAETEEESSEEEAEESSDKDRDYDAEIEEERKKGKPDPTKAKEAFNKRHEKKQDEAEESDDDKPMTKREMRELLAATQRETLVSSAFTIARGLAGSDKEAQLIVEKWKNRSFPENLSLADQVEEAYAITHRKKLIGERNEAMRALKGKGNAEKTGASNFKKPSGGIEPKLSPQDAAVIKQSGFAWNATSRQFEKKLANGSMLVRDPKTKQVRLIRKK